MPSIAPVALLLLVAQSTPPDYLAARSEFPPHDASLASSVQTGLERKEAARLLATDPGSPETIRFLVQVRDAQGTLTALRAAVDGPTERLAGAFDAFGNGAWQFRGDSEDARRRFEVLRQIVADARAKLSSLDREEAARVARALIGAEIELARDYNDGYRRRLSQFIEDYRGTATAVLAEVDAINSGRPTPEMLDRLESFAATHEGSVAAAKARYQAGFQLHTINLLGTVEPRGGDSTPRFFRVLSIVRDLESGRYPACEWVRRAPELVTGFFMPRDARVPAENLDRMIAAYVEFVREHWKSEPLTPDNRLGYLVSSEIPRLVRATGTGEPGVDRLFADLERGAPDVAAVRYLRAMHYYRAADRETAEQTAARLAKMRSLLASLASQGNGPYHRRALAALAAQDFVEGNFTRARDELQEYVANYPASAWAWVARLRAGLCAEQLGQPEAAASDYLRAAADHPSVPIARVLGFEYAARAHEVTGDLSRAITEHEQALRAWDPAFGMRYTLPVQRLDPFTRPADTYAVEKGSLAVAITRLKRSAAMSNGGTLERARALLARGRRDEAITALSPLVSGKSSSATAAEALALSQRARLHRALELADVSRPDSNEGRAVAELQAIAGEPYTFEVTAARIALGSLAWKQGDAAAAEKQMERALSDWQERQPLREPATALERDLAAIRAVVFRPTGGGVYGGQRWNAFSWPAAPPRFSIVRSDSPVKDHTGDVIALAGPHPLAGTHTVLFLDAEQLAMLEGIMVRLGGTRRREPAQIMEAPNQPVGESMQILKLWERFFPVRPGHWMGWEIETYPQIAEIQFTNLERTKAAVRVTVGYSGATVELEKEGGTWVAKRFSEHWIT